MTPKTPSFHSLSNRIIWRFCVFTLVISFIYGLITLSLMYTLEDSFIERNIIQEAQYLQRHYSDTGRWPSPRAPGMQLVFSANALPDDVKTLAITEPHRKEFFGQNGLHYHLHRFDNYQDVFLVAEVSEQLLVRPMRGGVIQFLVISAVTVTIIACLIAWFIGRRTTRPLKELANAVDRIDLASLSEQIASKGLSYDKENRYPNNEVGILANALDRTLKRIALSMEREKSFTRDVSHELRTPLAVIKNAIEVAKLQEDKDRELLQRIEQANEQMEKTVETLLLLAREEHSESRAHRIALLPILEAAIIDNRLLLDAKPIEVDIDDSCNIHVLAEPNVLAVILNNIVSNAFKYTDEGRVSFTVRNNTLHIRDTGPGLQKNIAKTITQRGVKGDHSTGLGFGLSIVKRLCEHQGLTLNVTSASGTEVTIGFCHHGD